jgi:hypothetical protein
MCGLPMKGSGGKLKYDFQSSKRLAKRAVKEIYQYTYSKRPDYATPREKELQKQRLLLAEQFRIEHASADPSDLGKANVYPHFIGVFDTVSAIARPGALVLLIVVYLGLCAMTAGILRALGIRTELPQWLADIAGMPMWGFVDLAVLLAVAGLALAFVTFILKSISWARNIPGVPFWRTIHLTQFKQKFHDFDLNENVGYARHAISIDENRAEFSRVPWGFHDAKHATRDAQGNYWFQQLWFAGNHSDIGGGYLENESRLSDTALSWMREEAEKIGLKIDASVLHTRPAHDGMQHDEVAKGFAVITRWTGISWDLALRKIPRPDTTLHRSVYKRFECTEVLEYDTYRPYRPTNLRDHQDLQKYYNIAEPPAVTPIEKPSRMPPPTFEQPAA